jgi:cyanophycin synthetase
MGHIVEHMALELSDRAGISVGYGKTVSTDRPGVYDVYVRYEDESGICELCWSRWISRRHC